MNSDLTGYYTLEMVVNLLNSIRFRKKGWKRELKDFRIAGYDLNENITEELAEVIDEFYGDIQFYEPFWLFRLGDDVWFGQDRLIELAEETIEKLERLGVEF